jgi:tetratricopeptide (TPR) repeat protein
MNNTKFLEKGIDLINKGKNYEALENLEKSIESGENLVDAYYNKGVVYHLLSEYEKAMESFNKLLYLEQNHINSIIYKGIIYCKLTDFNKGIEQFEKVLTIDKNNYIALMNKFLALKELKKFEDSLECLNKLIKINDDNELVYINKGNILSILGKDEEAIKAFKLAIEKNQKSSQAFYNMGVCYLNINKINESNDCFDSALKIKPDMIEALIGKSTIEKKKNNYKNSIEIYDKILKLYPYNDDIYYRKSNCLQKLREYKKAINCLDKALKINPNNIEYLFQKGKFLDVLGEKNNAIIILDEIFLINNKSNNINNNFNNIIEECHLLKGQILLDLKENEKANKEFDEVIKINPNNSKTYFWKGYINAKNQNDFNNAINNFSKCILLDKKNSLALYNLGLILFNQKRYEESKSYFIKANEIDPKDIKSLLKIGEIFYVEKKYDLSIQYFDKILKIEPNNELALVHKADTLLLKNNIQNALELYEEVVKKNEFNEEALIGIGVCKYKMNKINDAILYFEKTLEINNENEMAMCNKAIALFKKGEKKYLKTLIKNKKNISEMIDINYAKGLILFSEKYYDLAIENYEICLKKDKKNADIIYQEGLAFYENKKYDLAIKAFDEALKLRNNYPNAIHGKALVLEKLGNKKDALNLYKKVSELKPDNALFLMNYCLALYENNYYEKCKEILDKVELLYKNQTQIDYLGEELINYIKNNIERIHSNLKNINKLNKLNKTNLKIEKPIGLYNIDLNCYMNSVIQCLFHIEKFSNFFINEKFSKEEQPISCELKNIFKKLKNRNGGKPFELRKFKEMMGELDDSFSGSNGADATDLLRYIFSMLSAEYFDINNNYENDNEPLDDSNENEVFKDVLKISNPNSINNLFYFYNKTVYLCKNSHTTYSFDYGTILEFNLLDIINKMKNNNYKQINKISLNDCFIHNKNIINKHEFYCSKCQKDIAGKSFTNLYMTKDYLIIILDYGKDKKLKIKVIYEEYINIEKFIEKRNQEYYQLIGAIFHYGDSSSYGHYISYCRNYTNNKFYIFNDSNVKESSFEDILNDNFPYILFYKKYYKK